MAQIQGFSDHIKHPRFRKEVKFIELCAIKLAKKLCSQPTSPTNIKLTKIQYLICFFKSITNSGSHD